VEGINLHVGPHNALSEFRVVFYTGDGMPEARLGHVVDKVNKAVF
jgi:hypothetical protein